MHDIAKRERRARRATLRAARLARARVKRLSGRILSLSTNGAMPDDEARGLAKGKRPWPRRTLIRSAKTGHTYRVRRARGGIVWLYLMDFSAPVALANAYSVHDLRRRGYRMVR